MKEKAIDYDNLSELKHEFLEILLINCDIDHFTGQFFCKKCKSLVYIDWYRNLAFCRTHILSRFGITYLNELYKLCIGIDGRINQRR